MILNTNYQFRSYLIGNTDWIPILALIACDYISLWNTPGGWFGIGANNVILRSDPSDELTGKPLLVNAQEIVSASNGLSRLRFQKDQVIFYAKCESGQSEVILTCLQ